MLTQYGSIGVVLRSFSDKRTQQVWDREHVRTLPPDVQRLAFYKLRQLNAAGQVADLRVPPGNKLEKLKGDRAGQYSIRINRQWRICFAWTDQGPERVTIVDYH